MNAAEMLFSGNPHDGQKLSNEVELAGICPEAFKKGNHWTKLVDDCYVKGTYRARLRWKTVEPTIREHQWDCFKAVLASLTLSHEDRLAIGGWMLSECMFEIDPNAS